jgi:ABC-type phosphate transport system auxiliary subunit
MTKLRSHNPVGTGSDRRRKTIISSGFSSSSLFVDHCRFFREKFLAISDTLQQKTKDAVTHQLAFIAADLDTLRNENVVLESERNPEFRTHLATEVTRARQDMETVRDAMNDLLNFAVDDVVMEG